MFADKVFLNGSVHTNDPDKTVCSAFAVKDGCFVGIGSDDEMKAFVGDETEVFDLNGKTVLPGFFDAHCHPLLASHYLCGAYIPFDSTPEQVLDIIRKHIESHPDRKAYFGFGYLETMYPNNTLRKEVLDELCADKPVVVLGSGGHEGWCNTKAFELANVTKDTPDPIPEFHFYERDENGEPSGRIVEIACVNRILEWTDPFDESAIADNLRLFCAEYAAMGVTSFLESGVISSMGEHGIPLMKKMVDSGEIPQRVIGCGNYVSLLEDVPRIIGELKSYREQYDTDRFRINTLKIINDGTNESRSSAMKEPFMDGSQPDVLIGGKVLQDLCMEAAQNGFDINIHACGDKTTWETLMMAKVIREAGFDDIRITNSHTPSVDIPDIPLFGKYNVIANTTSVWHYLFPGLEEVVGTFRYEHSFMMNSILKTGAKMTLGSDFPVDEWGRDPVKGIEMGMTRRIYDHPEMPVLPPYDEKLTLDQCIDGYTISAAYQAHMEDKLGSIELGKYADFVIWSEDFYTAPVDHIHEITPLRTYCEGKLVYKSENC